MALTVARLKRSLGSTTQVARGLDCRPWWLWAGCQDSVDDVEVEAIVESSPISRNRDASEGIANRRYAKFLEDYRAARRVRYRTMASRRACLRAFDRTSFQGVMSHPTIETGLTNDWVPVVATLRGRCRNKRRSRRASCSTPTGFSWNGALSHCRYRRESHPATSSARVRAQPDRWTCWSTRYAAPKST